MTDPESFFSVESITSQDDEVFLTNIIITESLIIDSIKELSSNSSAGPDGIPASLLLNCASELAPSLLILFKQSLDSGVIDPSFKKAAIVPVFKSGDRTVPSNYRPYLHSSRGVVASAPDFERADEGSILTAGLCFKSGKSECNNSGYKLTGLTWWP